MSGDQGGTHADRAGGRRECSKATAPPPHDGAGTRGPMALGVAGRRGAPQAAYRSGCTTETNGPWAAKADPTYAPLTVTQPPPIGTTDPPPTRVATPEPARPSTRRGALGCLLEIVETVILTAVIFFVLQTFVAQPFKVEQVSMQDTVEEGQYVLVDKLTPDFDGYHRGDIVVFNPPPNAEVQVGKPYIKRVVGIAGDRIALVEGKVLVNGQPLDEPYVYAIDGAAQPTTAHGVTSSWVVPPGELFVMGDHRERSTDSRDFGPIRLGSVVGRAWLRYWPVDALGVLPTDRHPELTGGASDTGLVSASP